MNKGKKIIILIGLFFLLLPTTGFAVTDEELAAEEERERCCCSNEARSNNCATQNSACTAPTPYQAPPDRCVVPTQTTEQQVQTRLVAPTLQIPIPTIKPFTVEDIKLEGPEGKRYVVVPFIAQYIVGMYKYGVGVAFIVSIIIVMIAGFRWMTAGGNTSTIGQAKEMMATTFIGLVLLFGSYVLLYTINPDLLKSGVVKIKYVEPELFEGDDHSSDEPTGSLPTPPEARFHSNRGAAEQNRSASIDFSLFGQIDFRASAERSLANIAKIVIHNGGYNAAGNNATWQTRKAGAHYTIDRSGTIFQHAGEELVLPHAPGGNKDGIGIELNITKFEGESCNSLNASDGADAIRTACTPTEAQYNALDSLIDDIIARTSVRKNKDQIVGHCELSGKGGHADPRAFDWSKIGLDNDEKKEKVKISENACSWYLPF